MNKPVAWMLTLPDGTHDWILDGNGCEGYIPLYTHPVKEQELLDEIAQLKHINRNWQISENILLLELEKLQMRELTDEEIDEISKEVWERPWLEVHRKFARAILRKAQAT